MPTLDDWNDNCQGQNVADDSLSLPVLAGEVAFAQKQQISELSKRQNLLQQLKVTRMPMP